MNQTNSEPTPGASGSEGTSLPQASEQSVPGHGRGYYQEAEGGKVWVDLDKLDALKAKFSGDAQNNPTSPTAESGSGDTSVVAALHKFEETVVPYKDNSQPIEKGHIEVAQGQVPPVIDNLKKVQSTIQPYKDTAMPVIPTPVVKK